MDLDTYLSKYCAEKEIPLIVSCLASAAIKISISIRKVQLDKKNASFRDTFNSDGDVQKPLDIISDEISR